MYRHHVIDNTKFRMEPGYINFQHIEAGLVLATENGQPVKAPVSGNIFMPLYQNQGADGFFIIERTEE